VLSFFALAPGFTGGVTVAATAGRLAVGAGVGGGSQVRVFDAAGAVRREFLAYPAGVAAGGVRVGWADADGDGLADVLTGPGAGGGGLPVRTFRLTDLSILRSFDPFTPPDPLGVFVA
jgi:hypothetical protein